MKLILSLLKKILVSLSDFYRKDYVNAELDKRVDSAVFTSSLGDETAERKRVDLEISASIDDNEANDEALAKVIEWQGYADQICRSVDDDVAIAFAEEFEKATVDYLEDPEATKRWEVKKNSDGTFTSSSPYSDGVNIDILIDFSSIWANGYYSDSSNKKGVFKIDSCKVVFLPKATLINNGFLYCSFSGVIFLPSLTNGYRLFQGGSSNPFIFAPKITRADQLCRDLRKFNNKLYLPEATTCTYMLQTCTSYNQALDLPNVVECTYMLSGCSKFNFPISFPKAKKCNYLLLGAKSFNSTIELPIMTQGNYLLKNATSFNQPINFPEALYCTDLLNGASSFNQVAILPKCSSLGGAFANTAMSAENISVTLDSLPTWTDGASHVITFTGCPGVASTATVETFTATDEDGTEYSMENCPTFDTDDENQTLRKAFVLAVVKKGWTIEMTDSAPYKRELAYLQATGTQWIDTGVACIMNTTAEYSVEVDTDSEISINTYELTGFGSGWYFGLIGGSENRKNWTINTSTSGTMETPGVVADTVYTVVQTWQSNTLMTTISDGSDTGTNSRSVSPSSSNQFRLFGLYRASDNPYACKCLRIKSAKYTQDGVLVRDFIPVLDGSGIPCMYDKVSGELFANKGTGTFTYGELDGGAVEG